MASRQDVADRAGVAPSTVSLVLNGRARQVRLSAATRLRVEDAARELNYVPNAAARSLRRRSSRTIGLLLDPPPTGPHTPIFADVMLSVVERAKQLGYFVTLLPAITADPDELLAETRDADIAGLVCEADGRSEPLGRACERAGLPVVWLSRSDPMPSPSWHASVRINCDRGVDALGKHLAAKGYGDVVVLTGPDVPYPSASRYRRLTKRYGAAARAVPTDGWMSQHGRAAMLRELEYGHRPAAVYAANDMIAAGAIQAVGAAGLRVPDDIAIVGFGDFHFSADLNPPLTTVRWPLGEAATLASETLVGLLADDSPKLRHTLHTELVIRQST